MGAFDPYLFDKQHGDASELESRLSKALSNINGLRALAKKYAEQCDILNRKLGTASHDYQDCCDEVSNIINR